MAAIRTTEADFPETRPFQGQSPFLVNAGLNFYDFERGIDALLSFNVFGERLAILGNFQTPDVYEQPIPQLDFSFKKTFNERYTVRFSAQNLLNSNFRQTMTFKGQEYNFLEYQRGLSLGVSFAYKI